MYAEQPGSAEMASAGRSITDRALVRLMARGVTVAPIVLHTGVSSQEVPRAAAAGVVRRARRHGARSSTARSTPGRRVVAVGTTVVRALESAAPAGRVVPTDGWTDLVLGPERPARVVGGLLTGLHEPEASHLDLLRAVAGDALVTRGYADVTAAGRAGVPLARVRRRDAAAALTLSPPRKLSRTSRSALSTLRSTRQMLCQVPRASRPSRTGTVAYGGTSAGMHVRAAVARAAVPVPPAVVGRQQVGQGREQVVVAAGAGLDDRDAGRRVRHEHVQQPVAARRPTKSAQSRVRSRTASREPVR